MYMEINKKLAQDISLYCKVNELDEDKYLNDLIRSAFMIDKYGNRPSVLGSVKEHVDQEFKKDVIVSSYSFTVDFNEKENAINGTVETEGKPKRKIRKLDAK